MLSIKSMQHLIGQDAGSVEFFTEGVKYEKDGHVVLEYDENEFDGLKGIRTSITLDQNRVTMERMGLLSTQFVFEKGRKFEGSYETPFGNIKMELFPTKINYEMGEATGSLELEYELSLQDAHTYNKLSLSYRKQEKRSVN
jgi:uncharacterized beta-barrel protein YwiB (DUF1934 family)